jgi:hypothetical protein
MREQANRRSSFIVHLSYTGTYLPLSSQSFQSTTAASLFYFKLPHARPLEHQFTWRVAIFESLSYFQQKEFGKRIE